mmetsp:Transcript_35868/g.107140  ORF Transcript_35868/g.107140 Transcript_35868/m.107140 type:complete len:245 (+) Transcript_35868:906-1640(+)
MSSMLTNFLQEPMNSERCVSERRPVKPRASSAVSEMTSLRWKSKESLFRWTSEAKASGRPIAVTRPFAAAWGHAACAKSECNRQSMRLKASCCSGVGLSRGRPAMQLRMCRRSSSLVAFASLIETRIAAAMLSIGKAFSRSVFRDVLSTFRELSHAVAPSARSCALPPGAVAMSRKKSPSSARRKLIASSNWTQIRLKTVAGSFWSAGESTTNNTPRESCMALKKLDAVGSAANSLPRSCWRLA